MTKHTYLRRAFVYSCTQDCMFSGQRDCCRPRRGRSLEVRTLLVPHRCKLDSRLRAGRALRGAASSQLAPCAPARERDYYAKHTWCDHDTVVNGNLVSRTSALVKTQKCYGQHVWLCVIVPAAIRNDERELN